jgi:Zn-dependent peptidase ImmA (M78 family)
VTRAVVRQRAQGVLANQGVHRPPIKVESLARRLGLAIVQADLDDGVSGVLVRDGSDTYICVRRRDPRIRRRFTVAHEIGHFVLEHQFAASRHVHVDRERQVLQRGPAASTGLDPLEVEANQFAAELLMPADWVRTEVSALGDPPLSDRDVETLAKGFDVSVQAMLHRLDSLRLL